MGEFVRSFNTANGSLLDQIQRTLVGVSEGGGAVYKNHLLSPRSASTTGRSTGRRILSVGEAVARGVADLRPPTGRLGSLFQGLTMPKRNLPWDEDNRYVTEPAEWLPHNPQVMSDRTRHRTLYRSMSLPGFRAGGRSQGSHKRGFVGVEKLHAQRNRLYDQFEEERLAYKAAKVQDYNSLIGR